MRALARCSQLRSLNAGVLHRLTDSAVADVCNQASLLTSLVSSWVLVLPCGAPATSPAVYKIQTSDYMVYYQFCYCCFFCLSCSSWQCVWLLVPCVAVPLQVLNQSLVSDAALGAIGRCTALEELALHGCANVSNLVSSALANPCSYLSCCLLGIHLGLNTGSLDRHSRQEVLGMLFELYWRGRAVVDCPAIGNMT